ncbi:hypothetical protein [Shigella boydii]|uniref:hypothetical protein n=1 Tax=Shigella boydii TaxID=621 RepID=UPI001F4DFACC|nr:hypothetical protein [Shigella boydii]
MHTSGKFNKSLKKRRDRTEPKYRALDMTEHALKVAIRTIDRHAGEGYAKEHPDLISAFMTTAAANFATLTERGNAAGLSGYCRQRNQCPSGTP